jgi:hypothetical protein
MAEFTPQFSPAWGDSNRLKWDLNGFASGIESFVEAGNRRNAANALAKGDVAGAMRGDPRQAMQFGQLQLQRNQDDRQQQAFELERQAKLAQRFGSIVENDVLNHPDQNQAQANWQRLQQHPLFRQMIPSGSSGDWKTDAQSVLGMAQGYISQGERMKMAAAAQQLLKPYDDRLAELDKWEVARYADPQRSAALRQSITQQRAQAAQQFGIAPPPSSPGAPQRPNMQPGAGPMQPGAGPMQPGAGPMQPGAGPMQQMPPQAGRAVGAMPQPMAPGAGFAAVPQQQPQQPPQQQPSPSTTAPATAYQTPSGGPPQPGAYGMPVYRGQQPAVPQGGSPIAPGIDPGSRQRRVYMEDEDKQLMFEHFMLDPSGKFRTSWENTPGHKARVVEQEALAKDYANDQIKSKDIQERMLPLIEQFKETAMKYGPRTLSNAIGYIGSREDYQGVRQMLPFANQDAYNLNKELHHIVDLVAGQVKATEGGKGGGTDADMMVLRDALGKALQAGDVNTFFAVLQTAENRFRGNARLPLRPEGHDPNPRTRFVPDAWRTDKGKKEEKQTPEKSASGFDGVGEGAVVENDKGEQMIMREGKWVKRNVRVTQPFEDGPTRYVPPTMPKPLSNFDDAGRWMGAR